MKAIVYRKYGSPEVLQLQEVEKPVPDDHEVLIKVKASTVNRTDRANMRAKPFFMHFFQVFSNPKNRFGELSLPVK